MAFAKWGRYGPRFTCLALLDSMVDECEKGVADAKDLAMDVE